MKVVINRCYGGFGLSEKAMKFLGVGSEWPDIARDDPKLIECVEKLGEEANDTDAELKVVEIPDDVNWEIGEYDGLEWVEEVHRRWM